MSSAYASTSASAMTASVDIDVEAQRIASPQPAFTRYAHTSNAVDGFFSASSSRHDQRVAPVEPSSSSGDVLPPYFEEPPAYTAKASNTEPTTLAMYLFKFGFLFPPFWVLGALILLSPLRTPDELSPSDPSAPAAWLPEKTEAERMEIVQKIRKAEVKWARRCCAALLFVILLGLAAGLSIWAILKS